jgi:cell division protein FtsW
MAGERILKGPGAARGTAGRGASRAGTAARATAGRSATSAPTRAPSRSARGTANHGASAALSRVKAALPAQVLGPRLLFIVTTLILMVFGIVMVYSASFVEAFTNPDIQDSSRIFKHQLFLMGVGVVALVVAASINYRLWNSPLAWLPWAFIIALLFLTLVMGNEELGGRRWLDLFGLNFQPSEFAKIVMLLMAGMLLLRLREHDRPTRLFLMAAAAIGLPALLIMLEPDLGTVLIAFAGIIAIAWFGEVPVKTIAVILLAVALVGIAAILFEGFRGGRIEVWADLWSYLLSSGYELSSWEYASDSGYQIANSFYAFADGGVAGVGLGMSHQKYLYLPQSHNDLIYPIIGEEFGLVGAVAVVILFLLFLYAAYRIARNAPDFYGTMIAGSAATMIGFQAFLNMLCMVNILPMTGKPLPFFSAGGSSIISTLMLVGLILNVSLRSRPEDVATKRRDNLLILAGGQIGAGIGAQPARQQPARSQTIYAEDVRNKTARAARAAAAAAAAKEPPSKGRFRRPPARAATNPALSMSPARSRTARGHVTTRPSAAATPARSRTAAPVATRSARR